MISKMTRALQGQTGLSLSNWSVIILGGAVLLVGSIVSFEDMAVGCSALITSAMILVGTGIAGIAMASSGKARRRTLSVAILRSVTIESPTYRRAIVALRDAPDPWREADALERALSSREPSTQRTGHDIIFLLEFFSMVAVSVSENTVDELILRRSLRDDLLAAFDVLRPSMGSSDEFQPTVWLTGRWRS